MEIPKREVLISVPILLDARGAQPGKAVLVDRGLPGQEFFNGQSIAVARFLETQKPAANCSDDFSFAPDDPTPRILRRQIGDSQRTAIRPDYIFHPRAIGFCHDTLTNARQTNNAEDHKGLRLKI